MPANTSSAKQTKRKSAATSARKPAARKSVRKWSGKVTRESDALDLESHIFESKSPKKIAASLKHSAVTSTRRKGTPFQSAMSMLNFYINRAGKNLSAREKQPLESAKPILRELFGRSTGKEATDAISCEPAEKRARKSTKQPASKPAKKARKTKKAAKKSNRKTKKTGRSAR